LLLNVSRHRDRLDVFQTLKTGSATPIQELANRVVIGDPRVLVADRDGKELEKSLGGFVSRCI